MFLGLGTFGCLATSDYVTRFRPAATSDLLIENAWDPVGVLVQGLRPGRARSDTTGTIPVGRPAFSLTRDRRHGSTDYPRSLSQYRHHGPHRCREDDYDRADPLLHRQELQDR